VSRVLDSVLSRGLPPLAWLARVTARMARHLDPRTAAGLVLSVGLAALAAASASFGVVYDAVVEGDGVATLDRPVHDWLAGHREPGLTAVMRLITDLGGTPALIVLAVLTAAVAGRRDRSWRPVVLVAVTAIGSTLITIAGKIAVHRPRPSLAAAVYDQGGYSFPSGHSLNSAAIYGAAAVLVWQLAAGLRTRIWTAAMAILLVLLVGLSRMYLGVHWLTDVLAAYALGLGWLALVVTTVRMVQHRGAATEPQPVGASSSR
jgi:membrane-associated phospholipid phosphatase